MKLITRQEIKLGIQEKKRDFFDIGIDDLEADHYQDVITAFHHALGVVLPKVKIRKIYHVLFVVSNPCMIGRTGLGYLANTADVAVCIED